MGRLLQRCSRLQNFVAADWISAAGDAQHTNWQKNEKLLTPTSVKALKLVWKKKLEGSLTAPVMLGRVVTHKGIKDLLIVTNNASDVYAIDPDLGTLFGIGISKTRRRAPATAALRWPQRLQRRSQTPMLIMTITTSHSASDRCMS